MKQTLLGAAAAGLLADDEHLVDSYMEWLRELVTNSRTLTTALKETLVVSEELKQKLDLLRREDRWI